MKKFNFENMELLLLVKSEFERLGSVSSTNFNKNKKAEVPSTTYLTQRFKMKWNDIIKMVGLNVNNEYRSTKTDIIKDVKDILKKTRKKNISSIDYIRKGKYSFETITKLFGSWNKMKNEIGLSCVEHKYTVDDKDVLLKYYIEYSNKIGRGKTGAMIEDLRNAKYGYTMYKLRFGSMTELREKAGFNYKEKISKYSKNELKRLLLNEYKIKGRKLTGKEIQNSKNLPGLYTVFSRFNKSKLSEIWKEVIPYEK